MTSSDLKESLGALAAVILDQIEQGRRGGSLIPSRQVYFRWRLQGELTYSEQGVKVPSARGEISARSSWAQAIAVIAQGETLHSKEYQAAVAALRNVPEVAQNADQLLPQFVFAVTRKAFESDPPLSRAAFETMVQRFLDDIAGVPFECGADINLEGLSLESDKVEVFSGVTLRRPKREDFEVETPYYGPGINLDVSIPAMLSAVATVTGKGTGPLDAQRAVEKAIAMLRLFEATSVNYISYQLFGASVVYPVGGRIGGGIRGAVRERGYIRAVDEPRLLKFWQTIDPILPKTFYDIGAARLNYRDMAYDRYSAALMHPGSPEERMANAMSSLEALFLEEHQELAYKLRFRAAKVLCFLGEEVLAVRDAVADGYRVRSTFAHGARLSDRDKRRLEARYQSVDAFVLKVLGFVRKAIVAMLLVKESKEHFIALIDDALLDRSAEGELGHLLSPAAEIL